MSYVDDDGDWTEHDGLTHYWVATVTNFGFYQTSSLGWPLVTTSTADTTPYYPLPMNWVLA